MKYRSFIHKVTLAGVATILLPQMCFAQTSKTAFPNAFDTAENLRAQCLQKVFPDKHHQNKSHKIISFKPYINT